MWDLIVSVPDHCLSFYFEELKTFLFKQKYPPAPKEDSILKIKSLKRPDLLKTNKTNNDDKNIIPYVTIFNPHNPEIYHEIKKKKKKKIAPFTQ